MTWFPMKWKDKKDVSIISIFHGASMATQQKHGIEIKKPACVIDYNQGMGAVDLKDQKPQSYLFERKKGTN